MKKIFALLFLNLLFMHGNSQDLTILKGKVKNLPFSKISIQSLENPFTGARDEFIALILDTGIYQIEAEIHVSQEFLFLMDDVPIAQILLCPNTETTIDLEPNSLIIEGPAKNFREWNNYLYENYLNKYAISYIEDQGINKDSLERITEYIFNLKENNLSQIGKIRDKFQLNDCEFDYVKGRVEYAMYTFFYSELMERKYPIDNSVYQSVNRLPLNDTNAAKQSLDYNRALALYIYLKLRLENKWYEQNSFDANSEVFEGKYYKKILEEIENTRVRNITLTRKVCSALYSGSSSAESLYKKYLMDCSDQYLKQITAKYYDEYVSIKNLSKQQIKIDTLNIKLFEKLKEYKEQVLYLDFWASWCGPCLAGLPYTKKIQEKYCRSPFKVIYVNVQDNIGRFETTAKKLDLNGPLIFLNNEESLEIMKFLKASGIPHYMLIDKNGIIAEKDAPSPESGDIIEKINQLLNP
jgi:thiol-disulfide isomerase/thioredoxin